MKLQTRIAPTPSGYLHLGNIYAFLHTQQLAKAHGLLLRLRIDDLDRTRFRMAYVEDIFELLQLLGIRCELGPTDPADFLQNHQQKLRRPLYEQYLAALRASGLIYACSCSRAMLQGHVKYPGSCRNKHLSLDNPSYNWRLRVSASATVRMFDFGGGSTRYRVQEYTGDFVVRKKAEATETPPDPAYQLACVADDALYGTTHIVRGSDLFQSSVQQLYIAELSTALTFSRIHFEHHGLITAADGKKLSKSAGDSRARSLLQSYSDKSSLLAAVEALSHSLKINH